MVMKECVVCGKEFDVRGNRKTCSKECRKERIRQYNKQYRQDNKEKTKEYSQRYYQNNKEHIKQKTKQYRQDNKEYYQQYNRQYRQDNKEKVQRYNEQYRQDNKEYYQQYNRQYYQDNKEKRKQYNKQFRQDNKEYFQQYNKQYRKENRKYLQQYAKQYRQENRYVLNMKNCIKIKEEINKLKKQYDGDLDKILENIPTKWHLREAKMQVWFNESYYDGIIIKIESTPCCEVTGEKDNLVIHHLWSFNTHPELGNNPTNMVRITETVHKAFHKEYGYGNNTPQQWEKFVSNYLHNSASSNQSSSSPIE